jgi:hypothetical protein
VLVYPLDAQELGGTDNAQGAALRSLGHEGFAHIELGLELRRKLRRDREARGILWAAFTEGRP